MNFYPNNYMNYSYPGQAVQPSYSQQMPNMAMSQQQPQFPQAIVPQGLNGKVVDSIDVVKATEVPIGGYGIYPKADLSEVYIKTWNNNGTTSIINYKPITPEPEQSPQTNSNLILDRLNSLEQKLDNFITTANIPNTNGLNPKKKENNF